jgi:hypothetical protein
VRRKIMNIVRKATPQANGTIKVETVDGKTFVFSAIRAGIAWPLLFENRPGYYCIIAEEWLNVMRFEGYEETRGRIILLAENENEIYHPMTSLYRKLTDDAKLCCCDTVYGITEGDHENDYKGFPDELNDFIHDEKANLTLQQAPLAENPRIGIDLIMDWNAKGLFVFLEESLLRKELGSLNPEDAKDFPKRLNAVNALRFVLSSFWKYRPTLTHKDWRKKLARGTWRSA